MDIKQIKYLLTLDSTSHFSKAAEECHITQPTLSMRIRALEEELGIVLIKRGKRFEGFTSDGERILAWAKTLYSTYEGLLSEAAICRGETSGRLRVGIVPLTTIDPMTFIKPMSDAYPQLKFTLSSMSSLNIIDGIKSNKLDLGVCYLNDLDDPSLEAIELPKTKLGLLINPLLSPYGDHAEVTWSELSRMPLGLLSKGMHYRSSVEMSFQCKKIVPNFIFESDSTSQIIQAVKSGLCCAIMPIGTGLEDLIGTLSLVPVEDAIIDSHVALIKRRNDPVSTLTELCFTEARKHILVP